MFPKLVLDGVGVVRASLLKGLLEVVHGRSRLTLPAACGRCGMPHVGVPCLLVDATVVVGHGCGLLAMLLAPLLAALGALLGILDGNVMRCSPAASWGWAKLGRLVADGVPVVSRDCHPHSPG
jgi:hypothetical protein